MNIAHKPSVTFCHQEVLGEALQSGEEFLPTDCGEVVGNLFLFPLAIQLQHRIDILMGACANVHRLHVASFREQILPPRQRFLPRTTKPSCPA